MKKQFLYSGKKSAAVLAVFLLLTAALQADMPEISSPVLSAPVLTMPQVSAPQLSAPARTKAADDTAPGAAAGTQKTAASAPAVSSGNLTAASMLNMFGGGNASQLAQVLATVSGSADSIPATGTVPATGLSASPYQAGNALATNTLLTQILTKLDELSGRISAAEKSGADTTATGTVSPAKAEDTSGKIVRFRVNGMDLLPSCKTIYVSKPDSAGNFLLSGDREYSAGGKKRTETFYFLFNGTEMSAAVMQDSVNEHSFLYRLTRLSPFPAQKSGSVISVLHTGTPQNGNIRLELLVQPAR